MKKLLLLMLFSLPVLAGPVDEEFRITSTVPGSFNGQDIVDLDDTYSTCMTTDAAAAPANAVGTKCVYPLAGAANTTGASTCIVPAPGNVQITGVTKAGTTGDTIAFIVINSNCVQVPVTITEGDGTGGTYDCDGAATDAACVSNLASAIEANATLGPLINTVYTAASETVHFGITPGASLYLSATASDPTNTVITTGTGGSMRLGVTSVTPGSPNASAWALELANEGRTNGVALSGAGGDGSLTVSTRGYTAASSLIIGTLSAYFGVNVSLASATGTTGLSIAAPKGAKSLWAVNQATATFAAGGEATKTLTGLIPLGAQGVEITGRVIVAESGGGCISFSVGNTGAADPDMYAATVPLTLNQTFGPTIASYGPTAQPLGTQITAAGDVVLTSIGGGAACRNLSVRVTAHYRIDTPDTSN